MSRARHHEEKHHEGHKRAKGGRVDMKVSGTPDVFEEADERKHGVKVKKKMKHMGKAEGMKPKHRMDKPGRKRGGRVGADKAPLSSAHASTGAGPEDADGQPD